MPLKVKMNSSERNAGRSSLPFALVYSYAFRMPEDDAEKEAHIVMWDYNVGLVRITSLFKSLRHAKVSFPLVLVLEAF